MSPIPTNPELSQRAATGPPESGVAAQSAKRGPRIQISLSMMLLMMVVFAFISAALYYASQVPAIREELSVLLYGEAEERGEDVGRLAHRAFIMFTFTSPLLLACVLSLVVSALKYLQRTTT
ncbi:hypothetical protein Enr13x_52220 [Stieleria neptunia]|uniref:Uncharacterized protein n=1 Tax=Stieleria neptunia TaxID=2527979 RepID=A0A518HWV6_9BACT|nr:hypothetical protein [Stieleria neptunia]QDV45346.1 hypothetical protein Enr13x_52220 [Stieleria neptunia]